MTVVQADGNDVEPVTVDEFRIGVAETYDVIVQPKDNAAYTIFAQPEDRSGYVRGTLDSVLMRIMDVILAFPSIVLALVAVSTVGPKLWLIVLVVGLTTMPRVARVTRGASAEIVERDFVQAAEALGEPRAKLLLGEILPNITSPLMVEASLRLTYAIGLIASLSFLGFGEQPPAADWGLMINENQQGLTIQPWGVLMPVIAIALLTIGTSLIGDGLSRASAGIDRTGGE